EDEIGARRDGGHVFGLALGVEGDADPQALLAGGGERGGHVVDDLVVEGHAVTAGAGDLREVPQRVVDHQVTVEHPAGPVHERRDRLEDHGSDRDGLDEVAVADVEVEDAAAGAQEDVDLLAEACEVGRIERRFDLRVPHPLRPAHPGDRTRRAMKNPLVPWTCGSVSRNSGRDGWANCGHSSPSGTTCRPLASTTPSHSSEFSVQRSEEHTSELQSPY